LETTRIEALEEILRITKDYASDKNRTIGPASEEVSLVSTLIVHDETTQIIMPKSMVLDPGWFDGN